VPAPIQARSFGFFAGTDQAQQISHAPSAIRSARQTEAGYYFNTIRIIVNRIIELRRLVMGRLYVEANLW
jgi:hypothetical protein